MMPGLVLIPLDYIDIYSIYLYVFIVIIMLLCYCYYCYCHYFLSTMLFSQLSPGSDSQPKRTVGSFPSLHTPQPCPRSPPRTPPPPQHATTASSPCALHGRKGPGAPQPPLLGQGMLGGEISYRADNFQLDWFYFLYQASQKQTDKTKDTKLMTHVFCQLTLSNSG